LLDELSRNKACKGHLRTEQEAMARYSRGMFLMIAYAASCGSAAFGDPSPAALVKHVYKTNAVSQIHYLYVTGPFSLLLLFLAFTTVYIVYVRGVTIELDRTALEADYTELGLVDHDDVIVGLVRMVQILGWLRIATFVPGWAYGAAPVVLFVVPSSRRSGKTVLGWDVAQVHVPWEVFLLLASSAAVGCGFSESGICRLIGRWLAGATSMGMLGTSYLAIFSISLVAEFMPLDKRTARHIVSGSAETLNHPLALILPTSAAYRLAFLMPQARLDYSVLFVTGRLGVVDFLKAGIPMKLLGVALSGLMIKVLASAVFDVGGPFPRWACSAESSCRWVAVPGIVDGRSVPSQACKLLEKGLCRLRNGTVLNV